MRHLLSTAELDRDTAVELMDTADRLKEALLGRQVHKLPTLRGRTVLTLFYESSTRTRVSFEIAGKWMSADVVNVTAGGSSVGKGESLRDTALTLHAAGADCLVLRHPAAGAAHRMAGWLPGTAVINAGDGMHEHPTQALLDAVTLRERLGGLAGRRIGIVGDLQHSRVARSNLHLLRLLGAEVVLVAPPTLVPDGITGWASQGGGIARDGAPGAASAAGAAGVAGNGAGGDGRVEAALEVSHELDAELPTLDAVMMLRVQAERMAGSYFPSAREYACSYGLGPDRLALLPEHAVVLHPGPMVRGMEIAAAVADSPRAAITAQVRNGVHVRMAVLYHLLGGEGAPA